MSEYQYYEFRALDRPLSREQMAELRQLSTRAEITPTSFTNEYHWGDFKGDPRRLMEEYFDLFVYFANWGTHILMLRLPRALADLEAFRPYKTGETFSFRKHEEHVILEFRSEDESGDWYGDEDWTGSLVPLRSDLLAGDLRGLYLAWLAAVPTELEDDTVEPPVPPGIGKLTAPLTALADFLRVDDDLLAVAAQADPGEPPAGPSSTELADWIRRLPLADKDELLIRVATRESPHVRVELLRRFRRETGRPASPQKGGRTVGQLRSMAEARFEERRRKEEQQKAAEREQRRREEETARNRYLDELSSKEARAWKDVDALIKLKQPKKYDEALQLLADLREIGRREGREQEVLSRIRRLRDVHQKKPSLLRRLDKAGLQ